MSNLAERLALLTPEKREMFLRQMRVKKGETQEQILPQARAVDGIPLSFAQQQLWFMHQLKPQIPFYNMHAAFHLSGRLHMAALELSLATVVQRHEILRTTFHERAGHPIQVIAPTLPIQVPVIDLRGLAAAEREQQITQLARAEALHPFDLVNGPLLRVYLLQLNVGADSDKPSPVSCTDHVLLFTLHHIVSDGWSMGVLVREMTTLYQARMNGKLIALPKLPIQYADYALWQRQWLQGVGTEQATVGTGPDLQSQLAYWRQQLAGAPALLELPTDRPRPAVQRYTGAQQSRLLSLKLLAQLKSLSQQEGVTLFMTLLATFQLLLMRYSDQQDIVVGTSIANRTREELKGLIGFFINMLVLRTDLSGNPSFLQLLARVREVALQAYAHQDIPFEKLVEELQPARDLSHASLFQVLFSLETLGTSPLHKLELPGLDFRPMSVESQTAKFDLSLMLSEEQTGLLTMVEYNTDLFDAATITRFLGHWQVLLEAIVRDPEQSIETLPLLTEAEHAVLAQGQYRSNLVQMPPNPVGTGFTPPVQIPSNPVGTGFIPPVQMPPNPVGTGFIPVRSDLCLHQLFEQQLERTPEAVAVVFEESTLTYRELDDRANQLAYVLQRRCAIGPDILVGVCIERSLELVIGLLAILKAGAVYVPLDPNYPAERLAWMLTDAQPVVVLTQTHLVTALSSYHNQFICLDVDWEDLIQDLAGQANMPCSASVTPHNLAYMIYTSGSTGHPKGVMNTHQGICNTLLWAQEANQLTQSDCLLQRISLSFDPSLQEIFWPLITGAKLVIPPPERYQDISAFVSRLAQYAVTVLLIVPSVLQVLISEGGSEWRACQDLRLVICGGERLSLELLNRFFASHSASLQNLYGPTEAAIDATVWQCEPEPYHSGGAGPAYSRIPIGHPIANTQIYLLDKHQQLVPVGIPAELYIGGVNLARGYLNRADLTAERFIPHPFVGTGSVREEGARLYRTGDLARYRPDGAIEYLGRTDQQVKLRGFRIELGEIEAVLRTHPAVQECVVVLQEEHETRKGLVAYVVPAPSQLAYVVGTGVSLTKNGQAGTEKPLSALAPFERVWVAPTDRGFSFGAEPLEGERNPCPYEKPTPESVEPLIVLELPDLQGYLREQLPDYMVPMGVVFLETIPLTPNGKADRNALPIFDPMRQVHSNPNETQAAPVSEAEPSAAQNTPVAQGTQATTPLQEVLITVWKEVLDLPQVGIDDNFFALGGHSLLVTQVVSRIRQIIGVDLPLESLFEAPTLVALADHLEGLVHGAQSTDVSMGLLGSGGGQAPIRPMERPIDLPLSFVQERLWFLDKWALGSAWYNVPMAFRLVGLLHVRALERSLATVVQRHEVLRTTFAERSGRPVQVIAPTLPILVPVIDLRGLAAAERDQQVAQLARAEAQRPFDLAKGPLLRMYLLRLAAAYGQDQAQYHSNKEEHVLLFMLHHIVSDGWSGGILAREITALYQAEMNGGSSGQTQGTAPVASPQVPTLPELPLQYADYALWQRQWLQGEVLDTQLAYWRKRLAEISPLDLPTDHPRPAIKTDKGASQSRLLPLPLSKELLALSQQQDVTLFMLLLGTFQVLLMRYTEQTDICVGTPIANRTRAELEDLIGCFVNTLVLRTDLAGNPTFEQFLSRVRETCLGAYVHQDIPFEKVVEEIEPERDMSRSPLFQVMFVMQNTPTASGLAPRETLAGITIEPLTLPTDTSCKFDLTVALIETEQGLHCALEYSTDLFEADTITRWLNHWQTLLEGVVQNPQAHISDLPLLTATEQTQILAQGTGPTEWNALQCNHWQGLSLHQLIERQVEQTPDAIAVVFDALTCCAWPGFASHISYAELNSQANHLARRLRQEGIGPNVLVGVCMERSLELVLALLAILKVGGAYVPLDPTYPQERLHYMIQDAQITVLLTQSDLRERLPADRVTIITVDPSRNVEVATQEHNPVSTTQPDHLAYVIYTSGTTGSPKGAGVYHRGFMNLLQWYTHEFMLTAQDRVLLCTSFSFDLTGKNIFAPLMVGGTLSLLEPGYYDPSTIVCTIMEQEITLLNCTPSAFYPLLDSTKKEAFAPLASLKHLILGGEPISPSRLWPWVTSTHFQTEIVNTYGPTECTDVVAYHRLQEYQRYQNTAIPLGKPINNVQLLVLDRYLQLLPLGAVGELYIAGESVGMGYINASQQTEACFIANPFATIANDTLYRTGDLASYLPDGTLKFIGRADHQVKLRGFRIELEEIEAELSKHPAIKAVACVPRARVEPAREDTSDNKQLVAYLVADPDAPHPSIEDLRLSLKEKLPAYMVPDIFIYLDTLPLSPNGKVDRKALLEIGDPMGAESYRLCMQNAGAVPPSYEASPQAMLQELLVPIWKDVLHLPQVDVHDNFFELGGHSLLATQVVARIRQVIGVDLPLRSLFETPTIAPLARHLEGLMRGVPPMRIPLEPAHRLRTMEHPSDPHVGLSPEHLPLSFAQERLWFLSQLAEEDAWYNVPTALHLSGPLDILVLERSLGTVVQRHEVLRTTFVSLEGHPVQVIAPFEAVGALQVPVIDLSGLATAEREQQTTQLARAEAQRPFDLANGSLLRAYLLRLDVEADRAGPCPVSCTDHVLLFTLHHIVCDGWSMGILVHEVTTLYQAQISGEPSEQAQESGASLDLTFPTLPELPIQYADYALWQRQWLQGEVLQSHLAYWQQQLAGAPALLELPTDRPRPAVQTNAGGKLALLLSPILLQELKGVSQREGVTLFMTLLAAFQVLLMRYTGKLDIVVGTPIANRGHAGLEDLIGFFVNTLVLRSDLSGNPSFRQLLARVREMALQAYMHQDLPFEKLVESLHVERSLSYSPLFQVFFALQNVPKSDLILQGLTIRHLESMRSSTQFDLNLELTEEQAGLQTVVEYNTDLFDAATITRLLGHWQVLLEAIVRDPEQDIETLPLLTEAERKVLTQGPVQWNEIAVGTCPPPQDLCLHQLFEQQVELTPDAIVVVFGGDSIYGFTPHLTYQQLNAQANQLAYRLRAVGIGPDRLVGVCMERSLELVVALLAVLKAGGAYVPFDPQYPTERLAFMLANAQIGLVITTSTQLAATKLDTTHLQTICLDRDWPTIAEQSRENLTSGILAEDLAYVIYTSGSTGTPKGVAVEHRAIVNRMHWSQQAFPLASRDRVLQIASFSFDIALWELFAPLIAGARVLLAPTDATQDPAGLVHWLIEQAVTVAHAVPSLLRVWLQEPTFRQTQELRHFFCGGEAWWPGLAQRFVEQHHACLTQWYGPTEAAISVTSWTCPTSDTSTWAVRHTPPLGRPIANTQIYLLDRNGQPVPMGVTGEIYLAGTCLARGYVGQATWTAERFVPNPFVGTVPCACPEPGARLYRTGDRARYLADGQLEFLGRQDQQVKVRGIRVELGEIEAVLLQHPVVHEAVVSVQEDTPENKSLRAYLVLQSELDDQRGQKLKEIREYLSTRLPAPMLPSSFVLLEHLPLLPNGKLDRTALSKIDQNRPEQLDAYIAPRTHIERRLATIWTELLQLEQVSITDNFFEVGGHSLLAVQLLNRINKEFGSSKLSLTTLFQVPTIEQAATLLQRDAKLTAQSLRLHTSSPIVTLQHAGKKLPFFCVHPGPGVVYSYLDLAKHLRHDRPFYGIQAPGLIGIVPRADPDPHQDLVGIVPRADPDPDLFSSIEEMAAYYVNEISAIQPANAPYFLGGHSLGGYVAFEMARQLQARGDSVALLALMDCYPNPVPTPFSVPTRPWETVKDYAEPIVKLAEPMSRHWRKKIAVSYDELCCLQPDEQLAYFLERLRQVQVVPDDMDISQLRRYLQVHESHDYSLQRYQPRPYAGRITLFHSESAEEDPSLWTPFSSEPVEVHTVSGDHISMVAEPYVQSLALQLQQCLDKAESV